MQSGNLYVYAINSPITWCDVTGEVGILATIAIGAAVNVVTTYIAAKVTGQSYTWKDAGIAVLSGALSSVDNWGAKILGGVIAGAYTAYNAYSSGASVGEAFFDGVISGTVTVFSVTNVTKAITNIKVTTAIGIVADTTLGVGINSTAAAYHRGITSTATAKSTTSKATSTSTSTSTSKAKQNVTQSKTTSAPTALSKSAKGGKVVAMLY